MREAMIEARLAYDKGEIPVGAVVTRGGEIVGRGRNGRKVDTIPFAHAEMCALSEAGENLHTWRFDGCELYVTLEPCPMCAGAIMQTRISRVVYGASDPKAGAAGTLYDILRDPRMPHRCEVTGGVMATEAADLLRKFFLLKRKRAHGQGDCASLRARAEPGS
ncbi:MAG: tRNA adenosine(34) deaminase TadA [Synergistaceae bacterium]|nr:tRNA adenosine(34) deaminase TadA [Synergistaceae bacterium]